MNLDIVQLILNPVLQDKTLDISKDQNEARKAGFEIFKEINYEFNDDDCYQ